MLQRAVRFPLAVLSLTVAIVTTHGQTNLTAKVNGFQPANAADAASGESDRARDGLVGPVRRVRTEIVKLTNVGGKSVEDAKRVLLETAEYDLKGGKTQNQYFPVAGASLTGREVYKYDDKGNISEMTLVSADGALVSKEVYKYEYDSVGNWVKMTTAVAVVESGRIGYEPSEVTYRSIFYYLDASMAKMLDSSAPASDSKSAKTENKSSGNPSVTESKGAALPPSTSLDKLKAGAVQPVAANLQVLSDANKRIAIADNEAPPAHPRQLLKPISGGVLNGMALTLPPPSYPDVARRTHIEGTVQVEVVVDETGKVISARVLSGPALLRDAASQAAFRAHFSPTKLSGLPVKVTGMINYNFTLPR
jgi:TonB family protein